METAPHSEWQNGKILGPGSRLVRRQSFAKMHIRNDIDAAFDVTKQKYKAAKLVKVPKKCKTVQAPPQWVAVPSC